MPKKDVSPYPCPTTMTWGSQSMCNMSCSQSFRHISSLFLTISHCYSNHFPLYWFPLNPMWSICPCCMMLHLPWHHLHSGKITTNLIVNSRECYITIKFLVGGIATHLKNLKVGMLKFHKFPSWMEKHLSTHQCLHQHLIWINYYISLYFTNLKSSAIKDDDSTYIHHHLWWGRWFRSWLNLPRLV